MARLGDFCTKQSSNIRQSDLDSRDGSYPIYGASGFIKTVDFYEQTKPYVAVVKDGAGIGRVMKLPAYSSVIGTMQYIIPNDGVDVGYLAYAMEYMKLEKYYSGATIPHIYFRDYCKETMKEVSVEEQKQIVYALDLITSLISLRKKQLQKLDDLVKSRFVEMFGDPIHPTGFYALGEVATLERGRFSPRPRNDPKYYNGDYPFIQTGDIASCNHRLWNYTQTLNELGIKVSKKFDTGTIVMAIVGATIGATAILQREVYAPDSVVGITPHTYNNIFLESLLQFWRPELLATAPESARANINLSILGSIPIVRANQSQQQAFSDFVFQIDKTKLTVQQGLDKLELLKQSLMQKYFG